VSKGNSTTTVISSANPSVAGQSVTFTATVDSVTAGAANRTGTVQFRIDGVDFGAPVMLSANSATSGAISSLSVAGHIVTAIYSGDVNFNGSTSPNFTQTVNKASTTTAVASSVNPSVFGQAVSFTATVNPSAAGGTVQFKIDGGNFGAPVPVVAGSATSGLTSSLAVGAHTVDAVYSGDATYATSTGALGGGQVVNQASSAVAVASDLNPSFVGNLVTFTATVTAVPPGAGIPAGNVQFKIDGLNVGSPVALNGSGQANYATSSLTAGSHTVAVDYAGNTNFTASTGNTARVKAATAQRNGSSSWASSARPVRCSKTCSVTRPILSRTLPWSISARWHGRVSSSARCGWSMGTSASGILCSMPGWRRRR